MIWKAPKHLNEVEQKNWEKLFFKMLNTILTIVGSVLIFCVGILLYGSLHLDFSKTFQKKQPISKEKVQQRLDIYSNQTEIDLVENGIHVQTGLVYDDNFQLIKTTCTACHSAKLITQNRATRAGWKEMIVWMQETQGLWDLGGNEPLVLDYLATHYAPEEIGRRPGLNVAAIEWFILDLSEK